jgi:hypothetical protein
MIRRVELTGHPPHASKDPTSNRVSSHAPTRRHEPWTPSTTFLKGKNHTKVVIQKQPSLAMIFCLLAQPPQTYKGAFSFLSMNSLSILPRPGEHSLPHGFRKKGGRNLGKGRILYKVLSTLGFGYCYRDLRGQRESPRGLSTCKLEPPTLTPNTTGHHIRLSPASTVHRIACGRGIAHQYLGAPGSTKLDLRKSEQTRCLFQLT